MHHSEQWMDTAHMRCDTEIGRHARVVSVLVFRVLEAGKVPKANLPKASTQLVSRFGLGSQQLYYQYFQRIICVHVEKAGVNQGGKKVVPLPIKFRWLQTDLHILVF